MSAFVDKKIPALPIEEYEFVSTLQDIPAFAERKIQVEKGRGILIALEAACDCEFSAALEAIEDAKTKIMKSIEYRFEEMKAAATMACIKAKEQVSALKEDFKVFLSCKESQLSPTALLLCTKLCVTPKFVRFGIADVTDCMSAILSDSWTVAAVDIHSTLKCLDAMQKNEAIENVLKEALEQSQKGLIEALQYADLLIGDDASYDDEKNKVLSEIFKVEKSKIERNLVWLQRSWDLGQRPEISNEAIVQVGRQLASLFSLQFGLFERAEHILKTCKAIVQQESPQSEKMMLVYHDFCRMYHASAQYQKLVRYGRRMLENCSPNVSTEFYWAARIHLLLTHLEGQPCSLLGNLAGPDAREESRLVEMMRLLAQGLQASDGGNQAEAKRGLFQAKRIGTSFFPTSPFTALCIAHLALVSESKPREKYHREAQSIYKAVAPKSIHAAMNMTNLGNMYSGMRQWNEAEDCYRQAHSIYEFAAPKSIHAASNMRNLGNVFKGTNRWRDAEDCYRQAQAAAPNTFEAAMSCYNLGKMLKEEKRWLEAEDCYRQAQTILKNTAPNSVIAAQNLNNLGNLYTDMMKWKKAKCYLQAIAIYDIVSPKSVGAATTYINMGLLYEAMNKSSKGGNCCDQAVRIYSENGDSAAQLRAERVADGIRRSHCVIS